MKVKLCICLAVASLSGLQVPEYVAVEFAFDGRKAMGPAEIEFIEPGVAVKTKGITDGRFSVPSDLGRSVTVQLRLEGRLLSFPSIPPNRFSGQWLIGIDLPPFDPENDSPDYRKEKPKELWYISFQPTRTEGTRMIVSIPR
jgi:hypothetical protein